MTAGRTWTVATGCALVTLAAGCGSGGGDRGSSGAGAAGANPSPSARAHALPRGGERLRLDPAAFTTRIDNRWWPMAPGSRWVYRETDGSGGPPQRIEVTVTRRTKVVAGITARVVHDVATERGRPVEITDDWYAQDRDGNVWYLGEDTIAYDAGRAGSTKGSWQAGVDGAQAGVAMPAEPRPGLSYRQEHYAGTAEDAARVLSVDAHVEVPFGSFARVLVTRDSSPLEPLVEHKYYAPGVGPVQAISVAGETAHEVLVRFTRGGR